MVPVAFRAHEGPLPRNANGKIDRKAMANDLQHLFR
jgi:hypothetical protein